MALQGNGKLFVESSAGRGIVHINNYAEIPNVRIKTICDVDERLFPEKIKIIEEKFGAAPKTEWIIAKYLKTKI